MYIRNPTEANITRFGYSGISAIEAGAKEFFTRAHGL